MRALLTAFLLFTAVSFASPHAGAQEHHQCAQYLPAAPGLSFPHAQDYAPVHAFATGRGIKVAVIDTGIFPTSRLPVTSWHSSTAGTTVEQDCLGHGTLVAGVIAARDTGDGYSGIAPGVELISIQQTTVNQAGELLGNTDSLADAIHRAIDEGTHIINISVVSCSPTPLPVPALDAALSRAEATGVVVIAAAGNERTHCPRGSVVYPANTPTVLSVQSHHDNPRARAPYSLWAQQPTVSAPGWLPVALSNHDETLVVGASEPTGFQGTSFAAPFVSGLAALVMERHPQLSPQEVREVLVRSADESSGAIETTLVVGALRPAPVPTRAPTINAATVPAPEPWWPLILVGGIALLIVIVAVGWRQTPQA